MSSVLRKVFPFIGLLVLLAALWMLRRELQTLTFRDLSASLAALPRSALLLALLFTTLNYTVLTGYDQLAFVYLGRRFPRWQIAMASFVGYAVANNVGFAVVSGTSTRYRFYSRWGLTSQELSRVVVFYTGTFFLGLLTLGGLSLALNPPPGLQNAPGHEMARPLGLALLALSLGYAMASLAGGVTIRLRQFELPLPPPRLLAGQFVLSTADWVFAVAVLWILLPAPRPPFLQVGSAFIAAQLLGLASHVPGGVGVFETTIVLLLKPAVSAGALLPALVMFRVIYYLVPLLLALMVLLVDESYQRRHLVLRWGNAFGTLARSMAPQVLAVFTFLAGALLLLSGATPSAAGRLAWLGNRLPLPIIETSHLAGSLAGLGLLLVSQGLARRLGRAWVLAMIGLTLGVATSLLKGGDYEEALLLSALLAVLIPTRGEFDRRIALASEPLSLGWLAGVVAVVAASIWLGDFSFQAVPYARELWWQVGVDQQASRFLRATAAVVIALLVVVIRWLQRPAPPEIVSPSSDELTAVGLAIRAQHSTSPYVAYLRDKALLWNDARTAFLMYSVQDRAWIALHDPVGPPEDGKPLVPRFLERADDDSGVPVFWDVRESWLPVYTDYGLTFAKLGEDALVPLADFSLDGAERGPLRETMDRLERLGVRFRVVPPHEVPALVPVLRDVSSEWLARTGAPEKGFSVGFFDPAYLERFPIAVTERDGQIETFANVWPGPDRMELSTGLMRSRTQAPPGSAEGLLTHLMRWGSEQGYQRFNLGLAPPLGREASDVAPYWMTIADLLRDQVGEPGGIQRLRTSKERFAPAWEPRYLAYPGGQALSEIVADVSALVAGGYRRIFQRKIAQRHRW